LHDVGSFHLCALAPDRRLGRPVLRPVAPLLGARTGIIVTGMARSGRDRHMVLRVVAGPLDPARGPGALAKAHTPARTGRHTDAIIGQRFPYRSSPRSPEKLIPAQPAPWPQTPSRIGTVELASFYRAADSALDVGGDWLDAFAVDDGLMLVVGDVQGHDTRAARLMARLRAATRAAAPRACSPGRLLAQVGGFLDRLDSDLLATMLVIHVEDHTRTATVASAGHLPPTLLARGPGGSTQVPAPLHVPPGPPLGVGEQWEEYTTQLPSDAVLLLYTDGLVETREHDIEDEVRRLGERVTGSPVAASAVLEAALEDRPSDDPDDDVAVLVAHIP
jgi:hypothetical protein